MKTIVVSDSVTLLEPWTFVPNTEGGLDGPALLEHQMASAAVADGSDLDGPTLLEHRMANAWRSTVSAADERVVDAINADRNEMELDGPALQAYRTANAWKCGK